MFYVPSRGAISPDQWTATLIRYGLSEAEWDVNQIARDLKSLCQKDNISLIEPTAAFVLAAKSSARPLYYAMDSHWTPEGHRVAAQEMAQWILAHPFRQKGSL